ncbi:MAG: response regulator [Chloroflexota bacterium]|nr:response regulator [Chloroflexota bacterium]
MTQANDSAAGTVLVVDDDSAIAEVIRDALADEGYRVATAGDGLDAMASVETDPPAVMILDLMMPRLDGFGVLERLTEVPELRRPLVMVLSARSAPEDIARAIDGGAADFLTKPFELDELLLRVRLHVARRLRAQASVTPVAANTRRLEVHTFGGLRLIQGGELLIGENWRNRTAKKLFKYLFTHRGRRLARDTIVGLLWPDQKTDAAVNNLRVTVHVLREVLSEAAAAADGDGTTRKLGRELLLQQQGYYFFNTEIPYWSDVDAFDEHARAGRAAQARGDMDGLRIEYAAALELYRGPYLPEDIYDDLIGRERDRLREEFFVVSTELMKALADRGEYDAAVDVGRRVLREDHVRESVYRRLMRYLALAGRREEALQLYHRARSALDTELGVEPLPETRALYERLRTSDELP